MTLPLSVELMFDMTTVSREKQIEQPSLNEFDSMQRLIEQACGGCTDSFRELVQLNHESVRLYLSHFIGCPHLADDLAQEVFFVAYQKLEKFSGQSKFSTWIIGIARHKALHFLRKQTTQRKNNRQYFEAGLIEQQMNHLQLEQDEIGQARAEVLKSCLEELPDPSARLINQFYFQEMTSVEIAAINDVSCSAIRTKLLRIRKVLLRCINSKLPSPSDL